MVDFTDVLTRAIAGKKTYDERRVIYERARQALVNQLRALDPPLPESDVTRQRLALEEAIRKIESEASSMASAARAAAFRKPSVVPSPAAAPAEEPSSHVSPVIEPAQPALMPTPIVSPSMEMPSVSPPMAPAVLDSVKVESRTPLSPMRSADRPAPPIVGIPAKEISPANSNVGDDEPELGDPLLPHRREPLQRRIKPSAPPWRRWLMILLILVALVIAGAAGVLLALRGFKNADPSEAAGSASDVAVARPNGTPVKTTERVGQPAQNSAGAGAATIGVPQSEAQSAVLYDENTQSQGGVDTYRGSVTWRIDSDTGAQGPERIIRGLVEIPERKIKILVTIRRNLDQALPASHTVEFLFDVPPDFTYGPVESLERVFMKAQEQGNGLPLVGALARITSGYFLIGLTAVGPSRDSNVTLLRDRPWIDVTFLYRNGRRAVVAIGKGEQGLKIFQEAFAQWGG